LVLGGQGSVAEAKIKISDKEINVFSTHIKHTHLEPSEYQLAQVEGLISIVPKEKSVVMGDFNAVLDGLPIKKMREVFDSVDDGMTPTWSQYPEGCDVCKPQKIDTRLDYIFVTKDIKFSDSRVESSKGSDHLPVSAIINV
jgi:endonuclease/exonuclease/phosphatase family metal-dependent hydrolase